MSNPLSAAAAELFKPRLEGGNKPAISAADPEVTDEVFKIWLYQTVNNANTTTFGQVNAVYRTHKLDYIRKEHKSKLSQHIIEHLILQDTEPIKAEVQIDWKQGITQATKHGKFAKFIANTHPKDPYKGSIELFIDNSSPGTKNFALEYMEGYVRKASICNVTYTTSTQQERQAQVTIRPHLTIANIRKSIDSGWDIYYHIQGSKILIVVQPQKRNIFASRFNPGLEKEVMEVLPKLGMGKDTPVPPINLTAAQPKADEDANGFMEIKA